MPSIHLPRGVARTLVAVAIAGSTLSAQAANFTFSGNSVFNTDIVSTTFVLAANTSQVSMWTSSWSAGLNYDPTLTLWGKSGSDYRLVAANDDDDTIGRGQGAYDSGLAFSTLAAGDYLLTLGAAPNFAAGTLLSQGFAFDGTTPIAIAQWNQPSYDLNANDQKGTFWQVNLSGVDLAAAVSPVPEPSTYAMMMAGLAAVGFFARRRRQDA